MEKTTLCYLVKDDKVLLLFRNKNNDINYGKWIGVGGHVEKNESLDDCIKREVKEETNLDLISFNYRGIIKFYYDDILTEETHLYISNEFIGDIKECNEGILKWHYIKDIYKLSLWEGDKIFLEPLFNTNEVINIKLYYKNDKLIKVE